MNKENTSLEDRHDIEREFHDAKAGSSHHPDQGNFYSAGGMNLVWDSYLAQVGNLSGRKLLDFGCGEGWSTVEYARRGALIDAFDISPQSIRNLVRDAETAGVAKHIRPTVMAAEHLGYRSEAFDLVLGVSILHHTDPRLSGREVARVLKPGGRAVFIEPLAHNVFLRIFRALTPTRRTPTEQPMTAGQIREFGQAFRFASYRGYHLLSILPQGLFLLAKSKMLFKASLSITEPLDKWLLRLFPFLQRYCWAAVIEVRK